MHKSVLFGVIAGLGLLTMYAITMTTLSRSFTAAWEQFASLWWLMVPLAVSFGTQVGLYTKFRQATQQKANGTLATGSTSASLGMLACCVHHTTDVLPIIGLSAAATLIGQYQKPILTVSILINIIGIGIMWRHVRSVV